MRTYFLTTTLALYFNCQSGYDKLKASLPENWKGNQPINLLHILASNGTLDCMWAMRCTQQNSAHPRVLICADMAEAVLPAYEAQYPGDMRPRTCIDGCRRWVAGEITLQKLYTLGAAAYAAYAEHRTTEGAAAANATYAALSGANPNYAAFVADQPGSSPSIIRKYLRESE